MIVYGGTLGGESTISTAEVSFPSQTLLYFLGYAV